MNKIIFKAFLLITSINITYSQTNIYPPSGNVGIGTNNPSATLQIGSGVGNLHYGNNGVLIKFNNGDRSLLELHSPDGQNRLVFQSLSNASYLGSLDNKPLLLQAGEGNVGIGTSSPSYKLDVNGTGRFGESALIGTGVAAGYYQDVSNGAYRSLNVGGNTGYYFQNYNGVLTTMFVGLQGSYAGNVGIGTTSPTYKLDVCGTIRAKEIKVDLLGGCDFVFEKDYRLMDINMLEQFVTTKKHLPEIASEKEMIENGLNMKDFQMKLLQKIEELTLYTIEQNKQLKLQSNKIEKQNQEFKILKRKIKKLESKQQ